MPQKQGTTYTGFLSGTLQTIQLIGLAVKGVSYFIPKPKPTYDTPPIKEVDAMEGMASAAELEVHRYQEGSFYLGNIHPDHGANFEAGVSDDKHIFIVAGNAAGKGRSLLIQNAIRWKGGFVALDPKGEIASITAMRRGKRENAKRTGTKVRKFMEQEVVILDPFHQCEGAASVYRKSYNPLSDIDITKSSAQGIIKRLAAACIVPEEGRNSWISEGAEIILCGGIDVVLRTYPKEKQTLNEVRRLCLKSFGEQAFLFRDIDPEKVTEDYIPPSRGRVPDDGLAIDAIALLGEEGDQDESGIYKRTLTRNLRWLSEDEIKDHVSSSDISIKKVIQSGGSVYVVIPPNRIADFRSWLRLIVQACINSKIELGVNQRTQQTLFLLDEFPLLGTFKEIEQSAGFLRGYNCKLVCAIQNIGQVKQHYAKNWETFLGNAGAIIGFATNDLETEKYLSDRMGRIVAWETSYSINQGANAQFMGAGAGFNEGKGVNQAQRERAVRFANEIHELGARETMRAWVIPSGKPFTIERQNYDAIGIDGIYDSPQDIIEWEQRYGGDV